MSASITFDYDTDLTIDRHELELLNQQNWYGSPSKEAWDIVNRHFDLSFCAFFPKQLLSICKNFNGAVVLHTFGLGGEKNYSFLIQEIGGVELELSIRKCGRRFWFGLGYKHLADTEAAYLTRRSLFLPVGLKNAEYHDQWQGKNRHIYFVCPRINSSPYFNNIYQEFLINFNEFSYLVAGAQPIKVNDSNVTGFVSEERHIENMTQSRVMFYHSQEPNHIHYHPFEAVSKGMPLIFMAGGMLDSLGGLNLPGRCESIADARKKIKRILGDDKRLIESIRSSQIVLLEKMKAEYCEPYWMQGLSRIQSELEDYRAEQLENPMRHKRKRIAVILPIAYKGGTFRGARMIAEALVSSRKQSQGNAEIIFAHVDSDENYSEGDFENWPENVKRRTFHPKTLSSIEARRAMHFAGFSNWQPKFDSYTIFDDEMQTFQDCDLWLIVSDRCSPPPLPLRPIVLMVYDYLQRYVEILTNNSDWAFVETAKMADQVFVTSEFTRKDAVQYAGLDVRRVCKLPILAPDFSGLENGTQKSKKPYFIWTTNIAPHKNHVNAVEALKIYYEDLDGFLNCYVTGIDTDKIVDGSLPHLEELSKVIRKNSSLKKYVKWQGNIPDCKYRKILSGAQFLWHPTKIDNGTFSVIEAAHFGVPALSSDYPAMHELNTQFELNLTWMNSSSPNEMARKLKEMEISANEKASSLPSACTLLQKRKATERVYWEEVYTCL